jgi:hypothetical protein
MAACVARSQAKACLRILTFYAFRLIGRAADKILLERQHVTAPIGCLDGRFGRAIRKRR